MTESARRSEPPTPTCSMAWVFHILGKDHHLAHPVDRTVGLPHRTGQPRVAMKTAAEQVAITTEQEAITTEQVTITTVQVTITKGNNDDECHSAGNYIITGNGAGKL